MDDEIFKKKYEIVKSHYERAYRVVLKSDLPKEKILELYKELEKLRDTEFFAKKD